MSKILLFDFDGTIADTFDNFLVILDRLADKHVFPKIPREEIETLRLEEPRALIKRLKIPFYKIPFLAKDMKQMQKEQLMHIKPFKGLPDVLRELKSKGYELGILTSNSKENVEIFLKHNKLSVFDTIRSNSNIFGKHRALRAFMKYHGVSNEDIIYVGDEIRDIQACHKVGVRIISVTWGFNAKAGLTKYNPDFLIDTPEELVTTLLAID